jgi:CBS domain-containing protein
MDMVSVADVMTPDPITVAPDDSLRLARDRMAEGSFRRLPVVQCGRLVGIVTDRDLRRATNSPFVLRERWYDDLILDQVKVWGAMTANPITVAADAPLGIAAQLMRDHKIGGLPVVDVPGDSENTSDLPYVQERRYDPARYDVRNDSQGVYSGAHMQYESRLVGIITETDLLEYLIELLSREAE